VLANRYRITAFIGQGSTGAVFRADDGIAHKPVALRILGPALAQQDLFARIRARIERNQQIERLHPGALVNLVDITDAGMTLDGELFVVTDFIDGDHLSTMLASGGRLPWSRSRSLFVRIGQLIHDLHREGIVLGTLQARHCYAVRGKPQQEAIKIVNTALFARGAADLGPQAGPELARHVRYLAPEGACGEPIDVRSDIYSFGVIVYELLTGTLPFVDANPMRLAAMHLQRAPRPPSALIADPAFPPELDATILQSLAKAPTDRFQTMEAFVQALAAVPLTATAKPAAPAPLVSASAAATEIPPSSHAPAPSPAQPEPAPALTPTPFGRPATLPPGGLPPATLPPGGLRPATLPPGGLRLPPPPTLGRPSGLAPPPQLGVPTLTSHSPSAAIPLAVPRTSSQPTAAPLLGALQPPAAAAPPVPQDSPAAAAPPVPQDSPAAPPVPQDSPAATTPAPSVPQDSLAATTPAPPVPKDSLAATTPAPPVPEDSSTAAAAQHPATAAPDLAAAAPTAAAPDPAAVTPPAAAPDSSVSPVPQDISISPVPQDSPAPTVPQDPAAAAQDSASAAAAQDRPLAASPGEPASDTPSRAAPVPQVHATLIPGSVEALAVEHALPATSPAAARDAEPRAASSTSSARRPVIRLTDIRKPGDDSASSSGAYLRVALSDAMDSARQDPQPRPAEAKAPPEPRAQPEPKPTVDPRPRPVVSGEALRAAALQQSPANPAQASLSQISGTTDSIIAELPRRRSGWIVGGAIGLLAAAGIAALTIDLGPAAERRDAARDQPIARKQPLPPGAEPTRPGADNPLAIPPRDEGLRDPDEAADGPPAPAPAPDPDPEPEAPPSTAPGTPPPTAVAPISEPASRPHKKTPKPPRRVREAKPEEPDLFDQVRAHMKQRKAEEDARNAAVQGSSSPAPARAESGSDADRARETLDRARQASNASNLPLCISLARQSHNLVKSPEALELMGTCACRQKNEPSARIAFNGLSGDRRAHVASTCSASGITL